MLSLLSVMFAACRWHFPQQSTPSLHHQPAVSSPTQPSSLKPLQAVGCGSHVPQPSSQQTLPLCRTTWPPRCRVTPTSSCRQQPGAQCAQQTSRLLSQLLLPASPTTGLLASTPTAVLCVEVASNSARCRAWTTMLMSPIPACARPLCQPVAGAICNGDHSCTGATLHGYKQGFAGNTILVETWRPSVMHHAWWS